MHKMTIYGLLCLFLLAMVSCGGNVANNVDFIKTIDITDAIALFIMHTTSTDPLNAKKRFCKITKEGEIKEVVICNRDNERVSIVPSKAFDCNGYLIVVVKESVYLVSKTNGEVHDISYLGIPIVFENHLGLTPHGRRSVYFDSNSNIYYVSEGSVKRIKIFDSEIHSIDQITDDSCKINKSSEFCVDKDGNVLFSVNEGLEGDTFFIRLNDGTTKKICSGAKGISFVGYDGYIYLQYKEYFSVTDTMMLKRIVVTDDDISFEDCGISGLSSRYSGSYTWLYLENMIIAIDETAGGDDGREVVLYNNLETYPTYYDNSSLRYFVRISSGKDCYYVVNTYGNVLRINPMSHQVKVLHLSDDYEIQNLLAVSDTKVFFSGIKQVDKKNVFACADVSTESVKVIADDLTDEITILCTIV